MHRERPIRYQPMPSVATGQDSLPRRYPLWVQWFSMAAFTLAFVGWLNETWLFLFENPIWLNRYTEYAIILAFGLWRIRAEENPYSRKRLMVLVAAVTVLWWLVPWLRPVFEPYIGYQWGQPVFPSLHVPGTITFFLVLGAVFLFGRRVICGWNCPCVAIRETVGFAFRDRTVRGEWAWALRHSKWFFFVFYAGVIVVTLYPPNAWTVSFVGMFYLVVALTYFGTFFVAPLVGNRFYCRYLCPYGATFGLLNHAGFYGIRMDVDKCVDCRRCEQVCDMGIPVWEQGKAHGRVTGIEDCMGCARCVVSCPTDALEIRDVRNLFRPALKQNASHLLGKPLPVPAPRLPAKTAPIAPVPNWRENTPELSLEEVRAEASRCLDCGVPGCRNACPLANRIPDWLRALAAGDADGAGSILRETSALPEVCGRLCPQERLCEGGCTRQGEAEGIRNGAVAIGALERWLGDRSLQQPLPATPRRNGRRVAVIGAGPAGLACAERLARAGVEVRVYDRNPVIGGLLATGVPPFKLDKDLLERRTEHLAALGISFELGVEVGQARIRELLASHHALFLGLGAQQPRDIALPGQGLPGVEEALEFLGRVNDGTAPRLEGRRVLVLGGGDSAMDCARSALRLGADSVTVATRSEFRASPRELAKARAEGIRLLPHHPPLTLEGDGRIERVRFTTTEGEQLESCDRVLLALGQVPAPPSWLAGFGVSLDEAGRIRVDAQGRTTHPRIYAGGDDTLGPDLVVTAMAAGRRAADGILSSWRPGQRLVNALHGMRPVAASPQPVPLAARESTP
jgi:glutamate synthase (NADPH/NADH) small chain